MTNAWAVFKDGKLCLAFEERAGDLKSSMTNARIVKHPLISGRMAVMDYEAQLFRILNSCQSMNDIFQQLQQNGFAFRSATLESLNWVLRSRP